jgi:hypothetical protein
MSGLKVSVFTDSPIHHLNIAAISLTILLYNIAEKKFYALKLQRLLENTRLNSTRTGQSGSAEVNKYGHLLR